MTKVTQKMIEDSIAQTWFFTPAQGITEAYRNEPLGKDEIPMDPSLRLMTMCVLVLHNGFKIIGKSSCVDPANFDAELGKKYALEDAQRQIWDFLGFEMLTNNYKEAEAKKEKTYVERMVIELEELNKKIQALEAFFKSTTITELAESKIKGLVTQYEAMCDYRKALEARLKMED